MEFTDTLFLGFRDGRCVATAWKQAGKGADRFNARVLSDWIKSGLDIRTMQKDDPDAKRSFDQMWDDARAAAAAARARLAASE